MRHDGLCLLLIAKSPSSGGSKTRLCPPCTPEQAALLAEAALADTLGAVAAVAPTAAARRVLVLDGEPGPWLPPGFEVISQRGDGLDERLAAAFEDAGAPALLVGMDTPQLTADLLEGAIGLLLRPGVDAVLGEAEDGGYWAIGLRRPDRAVFAGIPMSTPTTAARQRCRLGLLGLKHLGLPKLRDVDRIEDAEAVATQIPRSRFAAALRAVRAGEASTGDGRWPGPAH